MKALLILFTCLVPVITSAQIVKDTTNAVKEPYWPEMISLIKLIASPEKYHNKKIMVQGYLHLEFEGNAIYLHKEDYQHSLSENAFRVDFPPINYPKMGWGKEVEKCNNSYVILEGTFIAPNKGHMGAYGGMFENITRLDPIE